MDINRGMKIRGFYQATATRRPVNPCGMGFIHIGKGVITLRECAP
jgi:hypothetical protein